MIRKYIFLVFSISLVLTLVLAGPLPQIFHTSDRCISCHNGLVTPKGEDISFGADWRSSMMAHSSRDPYWQASVRRETMVHSMASDAIQHECSACHMPMSRYLAKVKDKKAKIFAHLPITKQITYLDNLAADGISCTMCHQIKKDKLGQKESFTAGFVVDTQTPLGDREIFGPFEIDEGRKALMQSSAEFLPNQAEHIQSSELCASCHTLYTHALNEKGEVIGELPEQVPYLEWKHSSYPNHQSCQSCHMPTVEGMTHITGVVGKDREEVSRHVFRGGNFFMPKIFNRYRDELGVKALTQELETTSLRTAAHLSSSSAQIKLENITLSEGQLKVEVSIQNQAGHKLPSAYPSRRVWIHFKVTDRYNTLIFESGKLNPDGSIKGNDNDSNPGLYEPHYIKIEKPDEVQIYEGILAGPEDKVTTVLLTAVRYIKDNRLLPKGFDKSTAEEDIAVQGRAAQDHDFKSSGDRIQYVSQVKGYQGPFHVQAELWYQPIAYRWAYNLEQQEAYEIKRFISYFKTFSDATDIILAQDKAKIE
ncbi:MAG TPA: hypothetical protein VFG01_09025 [Acidobacteriota bacterium]|nr:hypothetical protein [Acidobacteriota bacterium]